jgi:hypothetical protein
MQWLETIQVQTGEKKSRNLRKNIRNLIRELLSSDRKPGLSSVEGYCHSNLAGDHLLLMKWDSKDILQEGSALGLKIKEMMHQYGLVDHRFWLSIKEENRE